MKTARATTVPGKRRRFQFSLRSCFVLITLCAVGLAFYRCQLEPAMGEVRWVNQRKAVVWIEVYGERAIDIDAGLLIYPESRAAADGSSRYAAIRITRILGSRLAEADIISDDPSQPIMPGDFVRTPSLTKRLLGWLTNQPLRRGSKTRAEREPSE